MMVTAHERSPSRSQMVVCKNRKTINCFFTSIAIDIWHNGLLLLFSTPAYVRTTCAVANALCLYILLPTAAPLKKQFGCGNLHKIHTIIGLCNSSLYYVLVTGFCASRMHLRSKLLNSLLWYLLATRSICLTNVWYQWLKAELLLQEWACPSLRQVVLRSDFVS